MKNLKEAGSTVVAYFIGYSIVVGSCVGFVYLIGILDKIVK